MSHSPFHSKPLFFQKLQKHFQEDTAENEELHRYLQYQKHQVPWNRKELYTSILDTVLPLFQMELNPVSRYAEYRPLYQLMDWIDPHYFRSEQIQEQLHKIPNLSASQQSQLFHVLKFFCEEIKRCVLNPQQMVSAEALKQWGRLLPESGIWKLCQCFESQGLWNCSSASGFRAWSRFTLGDNLEFDTIPATSATSATSDVWFQHCTEQKLDGESALYSNALASAFANELSHLGIKGFCTLLPQCDECPLQKECCWFQNPPASKNTETLLAHQTLEEHSLSDLLLALFQNPDAESSSDMLQILEPYLQSDNALRNMESQLQTLFQEHPDSLFPQKIKYLLELCRRYGEERMTAGKVFRHSSDVFQHFHHRLRSLKQEQFIIVNLDNKHRYLCDKIITQGILNRSLVHPREVFASAIETRAAAIICVHNHPSGDPAPSPEDLKITQRLREVGEVVGIPVLDHIIIGDSSYISLSDEGLL